MKVYENINIRVRVQASRPNKIHLLRETSRCNIRLQRWYKLLKYIKSYRFDFFSQSYITKEYVEDYIIYLLVNEYIGEVYNKCQNWGWDATIKRGRMKDWVMVNKTKTCPLFVKLVLSQLIIFKKRYQYMWRIDKSKKSCVDVVINLKIYYVVNILQKELPLMNGTSRILTSNKIIRRWANCKVLVNSISFKKSL